MKTYILYDAGYGIMEIERFDPTIDWHNEEWQGTYTECQKEANLRNKTNYAIMQDVMADELTLQGK